MRTDRRPSTRRFLELCIVLANDHRDWDPARIQARATVMRLFGCRTEAEYEAEMAREAAALAGTLTAEAKRADDDLNDECAR
jgi:hypothetical protein